MADTRPTEQRRRIMQSVKTHDTGPELAVRRMLFGLGYRYRLNAQSLLGTPDIVLHRKDGGSNLRHGCFCMDMDAARPSTRNRALTTGSRNWQPTENAIGGNCAR